MFIIHKVSFTFPNNSEMVVSSYNCLSVAQDGSGKGIISSCSNTNFRLYCHLVPGCDFCGSSKSKHEKKSQKICK